MGDDAKINGLVELYKRKFEDIYRLNDLDWRYIIILGGLITTLVYVGVFPKSELGRIPFYIAIPVLLLSLAGLVSVVTTFKTMHIRLMEIKIIEGKLNNLYENHPFFKHQNDIFSDKLYTGPPETLPKFFRSIMKSIRGPLVLLYSFVIFISLLSLGWNISNCIGLIILFNIFPSVVCTILIVWVIFDIQYDKLKKVNQSEN